MLEADPKAGADAGKDAPKPTKPEEAGDNPNPEDDDGDGSDLNNTDDDSEGEDGKDGDDGEGEDDDDGGRKVSRPVYSVPLAKHRRQLAAKERENATLRAELAQAKQGAGGGSIPADELAALAEESGLPAATLQKMAGVIQKMTAADFEKRFGEQIKQAAETSQQAKAKIEDQQFDQEFSSDIETLIKTEHGDDAEAVKRIRRQLHNLAFTEAYHQTPLTVIYKGLDSFRPKKGRSSAESGRPGGTAGRGGVIDFSKVTEEDIGKMDTKTFLKYGEWLEKQDKS